MSKNKTVKSDSLFDNRILRVEQVAEMLQFSKWHVYRLVSQKKIPFRKRGSALFFLRDEIFDWINNGDF